MKHTQSIFRSSIILPLAMLASFYLTRPVKAQVYNAAFFSLPQSPSGTNLVNGLDGFDFTPSTDLTVTALGWYDHNGDGLSHNHPVGIYVTSTETLVAPSALITNASSLNSTIDFRFTSVNPFTLTSGITYTLAGYGEGPDFDPYVANPSGGITFGPNVNFVRLRTSRSQGLEFPTTAGSFGLTQSLYFGPNFQFTIASQAVPEPGAFAMLTGAAFCAGGVFLRRRRKQSR